MSDPLRIADTPQDQVSSLLRSAISEASADSPSAAQLLALKARLAPLLGPAGPDGGGNGNPPPGSGTAATKATTSGLAAKAITGTALVATMGVVLYTMQTPPPPLKPNAPNAQASAAAVATQTPSLPEPVATPITPIVAAPVVVAPAPAVEQPRSRSEAPVDELQLLGDAQSKVRQGEYVAAERLLAKHTRMFTNSTFAQERDVLMIEILVKRGKREAAQARADKFKSAHADSAYTRRIDRLLSP